MGSTSSPPNEKPQNMYDVIKMLSRSVVDMKVTIPRRDHVLEDGLCSVKKKHFPFSNTLKVHNCWNYPSA